MLRTILRRTTRLATPQLARPLSSLPPSASSHLALAKPKALNGLFSDHKNSGSTDSDLPPTPNPTGLGGGDLHPPSIPGGGPGGPDLKVPSPTGTSAGPSAPPAPTPAPGSESAPGEPAWEGKKEDSQSLKERRKKLSETMGGTKSAFGGGGGGGGEGGNGGPGGGGGGGMPGGMSPNQVMVLVVGLVSRSRMKDRGIRRSC